jgi:hypothetical protein
MRYFLFGAAVMAGVVLGGLVPATATPLAVSGFNGPNVVAARVEEVGYWRRQYRRYGYPVPYAYYPPAYGYYAPPPAYAYYPPAYGYYAPPPAYAYPPANGGGDYGNYPPANGDYPSADGDYGDYPPANGS